MPVYGFADQAEFDRAKAAIRAMEEFLRRSGDPNTRYTSPAVTVQVVDPAELDDGGGPPTEVGVYVGQMVYRDFSVIDPDDPDAWVVVNEDEWVEVYGPNKEVLVVGERYRGRVTGTSTEDPFRTRAEVTVGGGAGCEVVRTEAANDGSEWTAGFLQDYSTAGVPKDSGVTVEVRPVNGEPFGAGSQRWLARDSGVVVDGKRRLLLERTQGGPATRVVNVVTAINSITAVCNEDGTITVTLDYDEEPVTVFDA